jgi:MFS family permease
MEELVSAGPPHLSREVRLLFATRIVRLFAYGLFSVVLVLHLAAAGLSESDIGLLLTLTLLGDAVISLGITTRADRIGRKRMLLVGALLMVGAGLLFASTRSFPLLLLAATVGVISPSGNEVGPFLAVEQAALAQTIPAQRRTAVFAWYNLVGSFATATGSLCGGLLADALQHHGASQLGSYRVLAAGYAVLGVAMALLFQRLSADSEAPREKREARPRAAFLLGLETSRSKVLRLAGLFSIDSFAGGFVVQAFVAYWFQQRFGVSPSVLGAIFFGANVLAGLSALTASWVARRIGLLATMVLTHLPSNVLLLLVPLMPSLSLAIAVLLLRFSISQMDVPTRQAYTMALVPPGERSAAAGVTGIARTLGASLSPLVAGPLYASVTLASIPFLVGGGLKIIYDLLIWKTFRHVRLEERPSK